MCDEGLKKVEASRTADISQAGVVTCDTLSAKANPLSEKQVRFLEEYRECAIVATAARRAGIHRCSIYRWRTDPAFVKAMQAVADTFFAAHKAKALAEEQRRQQWRDERERARRPQRIATLRRNCCYWSE